VHKVLARELSRPHANTVLMCLQQILNPTQTANLLPKKLVTEAKALETS
jgi:hypothetical protein